MSALKKVYLVKSSCRYERYQDVVAVFTRHVDAETYKDDLEKDGREYDYMIDEISLLESYEDLQVMHDETLRTVALSKLTEDEKRVLGLAEGEPTSCEGCALYQEHMPKEYRDESVKMIEEWWVKGISPFGIADELNHIGRKFNRRGDPWTEKVVQSIINEYLKEGA